MQYVKCARRIKLLFLDRFNLRQILRRILKSSFSIETYLFPGIYVVFCNTCGVLMHSITVLIELDVILHAR